MAGRIPKVVVIGPVAVDMAVRCNQFPHAGESVEGSGFSCVPIGAGYNSAIQAAICGCDVHLLCKVGNDVFGAMIRKGLEQRKVDTDYVYTAHAMNTGVAVTMVDSTGKNTSCVSEGANRALSADEIASASAEQLIASADICLICEGIDEDAAVAAIRASKMHETKVVLQVRMAIKDEIDMAGLNWPVEFYSVDVLIPEFANVLTSVELGAGGTHKLKYIGTNLAARGIGGVVIRAGSKGCFAIHRDGAVHVPGFNVDRVVEQGCCGDIFAGAIVASCGSGDECYEAVKFAVAASEIAAMKFGSIDAFPTKEEIIELLQKQQD